MARVQLTSYEVDNDLFPAVCARCGAPAADRVVPTLYIVDGWRGVPQVLGIVFGLFFFPLLVPFTLRFARKVQVRVPHCGPHADEYRRRERIEQTYLLPIWTVVAVVADVVVIVGLAITGEGFVCLASLLAVALGVIAAAAVARRQVKITRVDKIGIRLHDVHPTFVYALIDERARDRVSNPDRRGGHGDVRDDYDDEVT